MELQIFKVIQMKERPISLIFHGRVPKKGQFFIISSVIILLILYSVVRVLNSNWQTDVSEVQGNDASEIFKNIEQGINKTIAFSDNTNINDNLETFILFEKNAVGEAYSLNAHFDRTAYIVTANITLSSPNFYGEKIMVFEQP